MVGLYFDSVYRRLRSGTSKVFLYFSLEVPLIFLFIQFLVIVNLRELKLGGIHTLLLNTDPR